MQHREDVINQLHHHARKAAGRSYSPYSNFRVGAAVISESGNVYLGCNVENASFGLTQCAERSALTGAISDGATPGSLTALLIYTPGDTAHPPCGACRQVMHELMAADSLVVSCCDGAQSRAWTRPEYLPDPFVPDVLLK
jgi:cytidine deaminase